jgi:hypothetical protein
VTWFEIVVAVILVGLGVRSLVYWIRRPFLGGDTTDQVLFALFVTGRAGLWFATGGLFLLYASFGTTGQALVDDMIGYSWYLLVLLGLAALQFVAGFMLGRRTPRS